jgi:hypothetical protein
MATVFVTGGTGFLGKNLIRELVARGDQVIAIHRPSSQARELERLKRMGRRWWCAGSTTWMRWRVQCPTVWTCFTTWPATSRGGGRNAERQRKTNVDGTRAVVEAALRQHAKRFVHTSSISAFGIPDGVIRHHLAERHALLSDHRVRFRQGDSRAWLRATIARRDGGVRRDLAPLGGATAPPSIELDVGINLLPPSKKNCTFDCAYCHRRDSAQGALSGDGLLADLTEPTQT